MQLLKQRSSSCKRPGEGEGVAVLTHRGAGRHPPTASASCPAPPRAPLPRCAPTPPAGGNPAHLSMIGQSGPCLVPTGQCSCSFLGRARPSRPRIPARPRGHPPPLPAPPPAQRPAPLGAWERCCLPGAPGVDKAREGHRLSVPQSGCFSPQTPSHLCEWRGARIRLPSIRPLWDTGAALARAGNTRQALHPS